VKRDLRTLRTLHKDFWGGTLIAVVGVGVAFQSLQYRVGALVQMGPGYFPLALGIILTVTGLIIAAKGYAISPRIATEAHAPEWKGWALIGLSIVAFIILAEYLGLVPAALAIVFIGALGDRGNSWKSAAVLALLITVIAVAVFWWALQIQLPLFRWGPE
jgi:hypothetical protein